MFKLFLSGKISRDIFELHALYCKVMGRQRELKERPSVPHFLWRNSTPRLPGFQSEENGNEISHPPRVEIESTNRRVNRQTHYLNIYLGLQ